MGKILITGGAGYIGSHTIIEILNQNENEVISVDNYINSSPEIYQKLEKISGQKIEHSKVDLSKRDETLAFFQNNKIDTVIHFAALKSVPESVENPIEYYQNNLNALLNVMEGMEENNVNRLLFSSSCSIYGNPVSLPVTEETPFGEAESPYARSKQMGEHIIEDYCKANENFKALSLRYFNPAGAHHSALIGEAQSKRPDNLVPIITQTAAGLREKITVFGDDYNSRDGSCIRDYIHVSDIAEAHVKGIGFLGNLKSKEENYQQINLGSGDGTTVLEMLESFEKTNKVKVRYEIGPRRAGDVALIYANNEKARRLLGWSPKRELDEILKSAWNWQNTILNDGTSHPEEL